MILRLFFCVTFLVMRNDCISRDSAIICIPRSYIIFERILWDDYLCSCVCLFHAVSSCLTTTHQTWEQNCPEGRIIRRVTGRDRLISAALPPTAAAAGGREDFPGFQGQPGVAGNPFLLCSPWAKKVGMNPALGLVSSCCSPAVVEAMRRLGLSAVMMPAAIRQHWNYIEAQRDSAGCR